MRARSAASLTMGAVLLAGCSSQLHDAPASAPPAATGAPSSSPVPTAATSPGSSAATTVSAPNLSEIPEPTTTNTLPPPLRPTRPAPSTAGELNADSLPVPRGWRTIAREGGEEEGYLGNGTWVHARDPRYAAFDVITIGCAPVTRDDYTDPTSALEGTYDRDGEPGIALVLQFGSEEAAGRYFDLYQAQVDACQPLRTGPEAQEADGGVEISRVPSDTGLIDRRAYPDGDWTEVGGRARRRVTLIILSDPGHQISIAEARSLLDAIG